MFQFFPGNYMWTQGVSRMLASGGAIGEATTAVAALQEAAREYDFEAWYQVWNGLGDHLWAQGAREAAADHPHSAGQSFLRACTYYQWATTYMDHHDPRRATAHQRSIDAFGHYAAAGNPPIERVHIPYEHTTCPAWFVPGHGGPPRKPTAIYLPGLDSTKEQGLQFAEWVAARGFHTLLLDGPGVGETILFQGIVNRHDYEAIGTPAYEYLAARPDVDPARVAVVGVSLGGYRAPRVAAFEPRLAACIAWGAVWDYGAIWERRRQGGERGAVPMPHAHMLWALGARDLDEVSVKLRAWTLAGVAERIRCPMLVTHGEQDAQTPVENAYKLYEASGSPMKELKIFTAAEGSSAHCQNDNRLLAYPYLADWLDDVLVRGRRRTGVTVGWERQPDR